MDQGSAGPSRRSALRGLVVAPLALSAAGCSVRLESDAPDLPVLTTQGPLPDENVLLVSLRSVQQVLRLAQGTPVAVDPWVAPVRAAHRAQATRLIEVAAGLGIDVPSAAGSASPSPTPTGTPSPTGSAPSTTASGSSSASGSTAGPSSEAVRLADAEGSFPDGATEADAWACAPENRPLLVSLCVARRAAQGVLGGADYPHRGTPPTGAAARAMARAVRPAVYGFEQIAARTSPDQRGLVLDTLHWLEGARNDLGPVVTERERTSYALPHRVSDEGSARRLARRLLDDVLTAVASQIDPVSEQKVDAQRWAVRVWSLAAADHARWGGPLAAFPGVES